MEIFVFNTTDLEKALRKAFPRPTRVRAGDIDFAAAIRDFLRNEMQPVETSKEQGVD